MPVVVEGAPVIDLIVWVQVAATLFLTGLIWVIQVVHYPLMNRVSEKRFIEFHHQHSNRIGRIVIAPMILEFAAAALLLVARPPAVPTSLLLSGAILVGLIWVSTFAIQVPQHRLLANGFDPAAHHTLVRWNWIRTVAWTLRAFIAIAVAVTVAG